MPSGIEQKKCAIAIVGATGLVGDTILTILEERQFLPRTLHLVASEMSAGETKMFAGKALRVESLTTFDFSQVQIAFFSAGSEISKCYAPKAVEKGCIVIDNTSCFRYEKDIPLVVPEVNAAAISDYTTHGIIANPNCSTIQLVVALHPIHKAACVTRVDVATYQSVSGAGKKGIETLAAQSTRLLNGMEIDSSTLFSKQIGFNVIPHIDTFEENGYTREEMKIVWETQKILDCTLHVNPTCARVPVFFGHAEAVHLETKQTLTVKEVRSLLQNAPGVCVLDQRFSGGYPTQAIETTGKNDVFVGRIRKDLTRPNGINMWVVADNVRKGAALNAVQIAEHLIDHFL